MNLRLWDRIKDWVVLGLLLLLSVVTMLTLNTPLVRGMRMVALEASSWVERPFAQVRRYVQVLDEVERLREENIELASEVARTRKAISENDRLRNLLDLTERVDRPMIAARIVRQDLGSESNLLVLDVGREEGILPEMAVIDERGIVGSVLEVSAHHALVMPYLNTDFRVSAEIQDIQTHGIVRWEGNDPDRLIMEHVVRTVPLEVGQRVVTSGFSGLFPAGYPVGTIQEIEGRPGRNEVYIYLKPASPFYQIHHVFVLLATPSGVVDSLVRDSEAIP